MTSTEPSTPVTRFAPSPTGFLHLGNVRTALLNYLHARKHGGHFLLRFEDTDQNRSETEYIQAMKDDLRWLGLDWHGEVLFQSARQAQHQAALKQLAEGGFAYRCFCSEHQLALDRKLAASRGLPPRYTGRCRGLSAQESANQAANQTFTWRLAVHADAGDITVHDLLRGDVHFERRDMDDPVIVRSDGTFTFLLPNAVDDINDGVTHILRGDDHLSNSAWQVWLLEQLGYVPPVYLHHGLLLGANGAKLSKRTGSASVADMRKAGMFPEALVQAMMRLGHPNIPDDIRGLKALCDCFDAVHVSASSVRWDIDDAWRWHTRLLHEMPADVLVPLLQPHLPDVDTARLHAFALIIAANLNRVEDVAAFRRLLDSNAAIDAQAMDAAQQAGTAFFTAGLNIWSAMDDLDWKAWTGALSKQTDCKGKALFMPLRAALTGCVHGPEMRHVIEFLGREGVQERLQHTLQLVSV